MIEVGSRVKALENDLRGGMYVKKGMTGSVLSFCGSIPLVEWDEYTQGDNRWYVAYDNIKLI